MDMPINAKDSHGAGIVGWGVDADLENDPTYPMRDLSQNDHDGMAWPRPSLQPPSVEVLHSTERPSLSAVFGTAVPPSGLSGVMRRWAFKKSEGKWGHWLILMAADRVNVIEGLVLDLFRLKLPNLYVERGFRAEWRYARPRFYRRVFTWTLVAAVVAVGAYKAVD
jgi:hypothetical protein